jgi:hypothetical protein
MIVDIFERIAEFFPLGAKPLTLEVVPASQSATRESDQSGEPRGVAVVRLIVWDIGDGGKVSIRDIKEQEVYMGWPVYYEDRERVASFFVALNQVLLEIKPSVAETLMPHDLLDTSVLALKRATTREDFAAALRAKSRLGKYLTSATTTA